MLSGCKQTVERWNVVLDRMWVWRLVSLYNSGSSLVGWSTLRFLLLRSFFFSPVILYAVGRRVMYIYIYTHFFDIFGSDLEQ